MKTERVELGDVFYVFTNWGICKGKIVKIIDEMIEPESAIDGEGNIVGMSQYKLNIDIDSNNINKKYGFFYLRHQLYDRMIDALNYEAQRWGMKELFE